MRGSAEQEGFGIKGKPLGQGERFEQALATAMVGVQAQGPLGCSRATCCMLLTFRTVKRLWVAAGDVASG